MSIFDFFKRRKTSPELPIFPKSAQPLPAVLYEELSPETALPLWNDADGILISDQHVFTPGTYIICEVKYVPSGRNVLCRTRLLDEEPGDFSRLTVPQETRTAEALLALVKNSDAFAWLGHGYTMPEHVKAALDRVL